MQTIGTRHTPEVVAAVEHDRERLGMSLTEWMSMAVGRCVADKVHVRDTAAYRKPPTREELRAQRREARLAAGRAAAGLPRPEVTDDPVGPEVNDPGAPEDHILPADPVGPMVSNATALHECYLSYVAVGFTIEQATYLTGVILATIMRQSPGAG